MCLASGSACVARHGDIGRHHQQHGDSVDGKWKPYHKQRLNHSRTESDGYGSEVGYSNYGRDRDPLRKLGLIFGPW